MASFQVADWLLVIQTISVSPVVFRGSSSPLVAMTANCHDTQCAFHLLAVLTWGTSRPPTSVEKANILVTVSARIAMFWILMCLA